MIVIPQHEYPLTWPAGVKRCTSQRDSDFGHVSSNGIGTQRKTPRQNPEGIAEIQRVLKLAQAKTIVISCNLLRSDTQRPDGDSGVAVYWTRELWRNQAWTLIPHCMPCDRFRRIADNLHAIAKSIDALRAIERYGAVSVEQAFAGFAALPPGSGEEMIPEQPRVDWRRILGGSWPELDKAELLAIAKARHRKLIAVAHPDAGGSTSAAADLNTALAAAEQELGR